MNQLGGALNAASTRPPSQHFLDELIEKQSTLINMAGGLEDRLRVLRVRLLGPSPEPETGVDPHHEDPSVVSTLENQCSAINERVQNCLRHIESLEKL